MPSDSESLIVVCPLRYERAAIARRLRGRGVRVPCVVCGPGAAAVEAWLRGGAPDGGTILLAGLAGGLEAHLVAGTAHAIAAVRAPDGTTWTAPAAPGADGVTITSADELVATPAAKRVLATRTGAALVDLESVAFARTATALGRRWAIVRGVSDDAATVLPARVAAWTDDRGRTRPLRALADLALDPALRRATSALRARSRAALAAVGDRIAERIAARCR